MRSPPFPSNTPSTVFQFFHAPNLSTRHEVEALARIESLGPHVERCERAADGGVHQARVRAPAVGALRVRGDLVLQTAGKLPLLQHVFGALVHGRVVGEPLGHLRPFHVLRGGAVLRHERGLLVRGHDVFAVVFREREVREVLAGEQEHAHAQRADGVDALGVVGRVQVRAHK